MTYLVVCSDARTRQKNAIVRAYIGYEPQTCGVDLHSRKEIQLMLIGGEEPL